MDSKINRWGTLRRHALAVAIGVSWTSVAVPSSAQENAPAADSVATTTPSLTFGGAIRVDYAWQDYNSERKDRFGDFFFELFRADVDGEFDNVYLSVQYRWYEFFEAIHHGYAGYHLTPGLDIQFGIHQVPFGILPAASHSFWFGATYYMGFEDDYDTGIKLLWERGPLEVQGAFYKNAEYSDQSRTGRYSFDLVTSDEQANSETNQLNLRAAYHSQPSQATSLTVGGSAEVGQIYNATTEALGSRWAWAVHGDLHTHRWNVQLQGIDYSFAPKDPVGTSPETVQIAAFAAPFLMASRGRVGTLNVAREIPLEWRILDGVRCYADMSKIFPRPSRMQTSTQIVTGCLLMKAGLYTYVDVINGQNMWFAGGPGIGLPDPSSKEWRGRLNINMGFYF